MSIGRGGSFFFMASAIRPTWGRARCGVPVALGGGAWRVGFHAKPGQGGAAVSVQGSAGAHPHSAGAAGPCRCEHHHGLHPRAQQGQPGHPEPAGRAVDDMNQIRLQRLIEKRWQLFNP